ncbi:MAG: CopG family ribbon-helix-helix protein [Terracidiphilus sp.]
MTVSLPPALLCQFEEVRKRESRTRSELVREALRAYFESRYPEDSPAQEELSALRRGRAAFRRGDALSLKTFLHDVEAHHYRSGAKGLPKAPSTGSDAR